jgi:rRNA maturation protein Nop10
MTAYVVQLHPERNTVDTKFEKWRKALNKESRDEQGRSY